MKKLNFLLPALFISFTGFAGFYSSCEKADTTKPIPQLTQTKDSNLLIVLDGKIIGDGKSIKSIDDIVKPDSIKYVNVLKGKEAVDKYGENAKHGAVEIFTNKYFEKQEKFFEAKISAPVSDYDIIFDKVDIEASFPGGNQAWRGYLEKTLNAATPTDHGAPEGIYTTIILFVVDKDGNISDVKAITNLGYGMEEEVIKVIKRGPKWMPASQNGKLVKAYRKQPVTFQVDDAAINISGMRGYTLSAGIDNPVSIKVDKVKDEDLEFTISKGSIARISEGNYNIRADTPGRITLTIFNKKKKQEFNQVSFEVK